MNRPHFHKTISEIEILVQYFWEDRAFLEEIADELSHRKVPKARTLLAKITYQVKKLQSVRTGSEELKSPSALVNEVQSAKESSLATTTTPGLQKTRDSATRKREGGHKGEPDIDGAPQMRQWSGSVAVLDVSGMNTNSAFLGEGRAPLDAEVDHSPYPSRPTSVLLPLLPGDPVLAGEASIASHRASGDSWPPSARISSVELKSASEGSSDVEVAQGRILILSCWDALRGSATKLPESKQSAEETRYDSASFSWNRPDDLPDSARMTAAQAIAEEARAACERYSSRAAERLILIIPDWLDDIGQQQLIEAVAYACSRPPESVRLLWRSIALCLDWLESLGQEAPCPRRVSVLYAGFGGIEATDLDIREVMIEGRRILCPVRKEFAGRPPSNLYHSGLVECYNSVDHSSGLGASNRDLASRLLRGEIEFCRARTPKNVTGLAPVYKGNALCYRRNQQIVYASSQQRREEVEQTIRQRQGSADLALVTHGPLSSLLDRASASFPASSSTLEEGSCTRGALVFADRIRNGLPTYFDRLRGLDLYVTNRSHEREWATLIPVGTLVAGDDVHRMQVEDSFKLKVSLEKLSFKTYLRREGDREIRVLETNLEGIEEGEESCNFAVGARSAGGVPVVEVIPRNDPWFFGPSGKLRIDYKHMKLESPDQDGWPKTEPLYTFGWPKCGQIYAARNLFENLCSTLEQVVDMTERRQWARAIDELNDSLLPKGSSKGSRRLVDARANQEVQQEIQQMSPIGALRPVGTARPAVFLDPSNGRESRVPPALHKRMVDASNALFELLESLEEGEGPSQRDQAGALGNLVFRNLSWLGSYVPEGLIPRLMDQVDASPNGENLTAFGRCMSDVAKAEYLLDRLVTKKLGINERHFQRIGKLQDLVEVGGTTNYLRCFVYLAFQHPDILQRCNRNQMCILAWHSAEIIKRQTSFAITFVMALRCLALSLRYRRLCPADNPFLTINSKSTIERHSLPIIKAILDETPKRIEETAKRTRRGKLTPAVEKKMALAVRVREWLDWTAATDTWISVEDDEEE